MSSIELRLTAPSDAAAVSQVMYDALEPDELRWALINDPAASTYAAYDGESLVAGAVVRWGTESEIDLLAVDDSRRGQGIGKHVVKLLLAEAQARAVQRVVVGTASVSLDNILFYQKCGFRMSHVRRDYFDHIIPPIEEHGIRLRDMIVFDYIFE